MRTFANRWCLGLAVPMLLMAGCRGLEESGPDPVVEEAPVPDLSAKASCPDDDYDNWSSSAGCTFPDCSDTRHFADPETGWSPTYSQLVCKPHDDWLAADFAMIHRDSLLHVFYIKGPLWLSFPTTHGKSFGHEFTRDGLTWQYHDDALTVDPASDWDRDHVWAPSVVQNPADNLYYMFYAGVTRNPITGWHEERIGAAVSTDLINWTRVTSGGCNGIVSPGCLMDADLNWTAWQEPGNWTRQCRDPFVLLDPGTQRWYMVYTAAPGPYRWTQVIGLARSDDLIHWTDLGPIACTENKQAESPVLFLQGDRVHLMWTVASNGGIGHTMASGLEANDWSLPVIVAGSAETLQIAPEVLDMGGWYLLGWVQEVWRDLRFRHLLLSPAGLARELPIATLDTPWIGAANVHPGAVEVDNGVDDNCNGLIDEGTGPCFDIDGDLYGSTGGPYCTGRGRDCDDNNPAINPGVAEICGNGIDDNCNGIIDDPGYCRELPTARLRMIY